MVPWVRVNSAAFSGCVYEINSAHIVMVWTENDGKTRLKLSDGSIIFPREDMAEITDYIRRMSK